MGGTYRVPYRVQKASSQVALLLLVGGTYRVLIPANTLKGGWHLLGSE